MIFNIQSKNHKRKLEKKTKREKKTTKAERRVDELRIQAKQYRTGGIPSDAEIR